MTTDNKTLADVQPGGAVRLGDQAERARFEEWAHGECLSLHRWPHSGEYSDDRSSSAWKAWQFMLSAQSPPTCQEYVPTAAMIEAAIGAFFKGQQWSSIRDRDAVVMMREKMRETLQAALSAQPSLGGQGDALEDEARRMFEDQADSLAAPWSHQWEPTKDRWRKAALAARQPVVVDLPESLHDRVEALREVAARQPLTMADALAAGDGTLHGAIDHWQERALRAEAELAACQPVGEPVVIAHRVHYLDGVTGKEIAVSPWMDGDGSEFNVIYAAENPTTRWIENAYDAPVPAQAVDLGQFRPFVEAQRAEYISHGLTEEDYCVAECDELLALIDGKAVGKLEMSS